MPAKSLDTMLLDIWQQNAEQQRELGTMVGQLGILLDDRARASEQRKAMFDTMSGLHQRLDGIERRVSTNESKLKRIEPLVEDHERDRQRVIGGTIVGVRAVHIAWGAAALLGSGAFGLLVWAVNHHPPLF